MSTLSEFLCQFCKHPGNKPKVLTLTDGHTTINVVLYIQDIDGVSGDKNAKRIEAIVSDEIEYKKQYCGGS